MKYLLTLMCICCLATTALAEDILAPKKPMSKEERAQAIAARKPFVNSLGVEFVWIKPGEFTYGLKGLSNEESHKFRWLVSMYYLIEIEYPEQYKISKGFYLATREVNWLQYSKLLNEPMPTDYYPFETPNHINFSETIEWITLLNKRESNPGKYRLPTEQEWEYACKAGRKTPARAYGKPHNDTDTSDYKHPNPWQLYDMTDTIEEWVNTKNIHERMPKSKLSDIDYFTNARGSYVQGVNSLFVNCSNRRRYEGPDGAAIRLLFEPTH